MKTLKFLAFAIIGVLLLSLTPTASKWLWENKSSTITPTLAEINRVAGVTGNIQEQLDDTISFTDIAYTKAQVDAFRYIFTIPMDGSSVSNPADASTYYIGVPLGLSPTAGAAARQMTLPFACTLIGFSSSVFCGGTPTNEAYSVYLRANNTTDILLSNAFNLNTSGGITYFSSSVLSTALSAGDKIELKIVFPTWTTNPTSVSHNFIFYFKSVKL